MLLIFSTSLTKVSMEDNGLGKKGGGNAEQTLKKGFGAIPYFLEIANVGEAYLIFEKISVLPKVHSTNRPHRLKTHVCFAKHKCV